MSLRFVTTCILFAAVIALGACDSSQSTRPDAPNVVVTDLVLGTEPIAKAGDTLTVLHVGRFTDSTVFDSSAYLGRTFVFKLGVSQVIAGWDRGMPGTRVGGTRRLVIPPDLAYGATGVPPVIPPNATLVFDVHLFEVRPETGILATKRRWP